METKYETVKKGIKADIIAGTYQTGDKLPTESDFMHQFGVSRYTIRRAVGELQNERFIYRIQGGGMFVDDWQSERVVQVNNKMIGVITTHIADYIFPNIINGIDRIVSDNGYSILISNTHNNHQKERQSLIRMLDSDVEAMIIEPTQSALPNPNLDIYKKIREAGIPILCVNSHYDDLDFPYIETNDLEAEQRLVEYLFTQEHEKVLGVFQVDDSQGVHRMNGFVQSYLKHPKISYLSEILMYQSSDEMAKIFERITSIMSKEDHPTAITCYNDKLAIQIIDVIRSLDLRVPEDVSVAGFDDYQLSEYIDPSLTTMAHPKEKMGIDAGNAIIKMINKENVSSITYDPEMIIRNSTKRN
ncbi:transcriptional repressor [Paucilactobacillus oligofermentans DSM 15707 = LMG 22743]|uniref:Transcriptional repressor n=1 Tax=Paucilactobacillus oligofermentans DSM 15707 = LMG 22743 TaxID=1423778 RepID=A0A0R1RJI3_9LACO|nr:GntR family transcriptional regulator [Paucilactobacillus oligofermentans]KRL55428.1 transcriptional repressor [Paucilactobacillus oligofermentans DSM 15707 = LMG 22743]CUS25582.1 Arabinose metabolism transcriptional repressor [Paucilactobacillus oligofermentans DSM 15707 = LMG 22743]